MSHSPELQTLIDKLMDKTNDADAQIGALCVYSCKYQMQIDLVLYEVDVAARGAIHPDVRQHFAKQKQTLPEEAPKQKVAAPKVPELVSRNA